MLAWLLPPTSFSMTIGGWRRHSPYSYSIGSNQLQFRHNLSLMLPPLSFNPFVGQPEILVKFNSVLFTENNAFFFEQPPLIKVAHRRARGYSPGTIYHPVPGEMIFVRACMQDPGNLACTAMVPCRCGNNAIGCYLPRRYPGNDSNGSSGKGFHQVNAALRVVERIHPWSLFPGRYAYR